MGSKLELVRNEHQLQAAEKPIHNPVERSGPSQKDEATWLDTKARRAVGVVRRVLRDEEGAVTAEYAIVIVAAVAFAGILVAIMRSDTIRTMLVGLIENALGTGG
ncbi:DUF4244 domain-containing protein [Leucobacter coleopterorum]|uniref:DUF4244 domain-containing protein n=1 Tax=Leucobacter coleopterorum TaxID=2714933 RepID=A0ABX6JUL5_9MICO|nr:DUF4244 domain-containing protein [Leucobacter coleopterorum]QIM17983.1 DUF4244 domain-containing protein [Leucobacter coleopterorum]